MTECSVYIHCILSCEWFLLLYTTEGQLTHLGGQTNKKRSVSFPCFSKVKMHRTGTLGAFQIRIRRVFYRDMFVLVDTQEGLELWGPVEQLDVYITLFRKENKTDLECPWWKAEVTQPSVALCVSCWKHFVLLISSYLIANIIDVLLEIYDYEQD